jgi:hypothetical protein
VMVNAITAMGIRFMLWAPSVSDRHRAAAMRRSG